MALAQAHLVMDRLHELRDMFGVGQRATALVEELFGFLCEVVPLMEEIDNSLRESTGHMPQATMQLQNVTEATEMATVEILDLVDAVLANLIEVSAHIETAARPADESGGGTPVARLRTLLRDRFAEADPAFLAEAEALLDEDVARGTERAAAAAAGAAQLDDARDSLNRILISLQVQDITAQQLASVNHLIESIRSRLSRLVFRLDDSEAEGVEGPTLDPDTFNPDARYDRSGAQQATADALTSGDLDIDALFADNDAAGDGTAASADDIDALFGSDASPGTAASADDIDALFG